MRAIQANMYYFKTGLPSDYFKYQLEILDTVLVDKIPKEAELSQKSESYLHPVLKHKY